MKIPKPIKKISDYFLGIGDNKFYNSNLEMAKRFFPEKEGGTYIRALKENKKRKIIPKITSSVLELSAIGASIISKEPAYLYALGPIEMFRLASHTLDIRDKKFIIEQNNDMRSQIVEYQKQELLENYWFYN